MVLCKVNNNNMWNNLVFVILLNVLMIHGQYYDSSLDNLGARISARVASEVAPLQGLGERINAQVQQNLRPMQVRYERDMVNLNSRLSELDGLGDRISQQVYQGLEPARGMELNFKMKDGVGGVTIATHYPAGRQFIIENYQLLTCDSQIDLTTGSCSGNLTPFKITSSSPKSDWCYLQSYSQVNNVVCLSTGSTSIEAINGQVNCRSTDNSPTLQIGLDEYKRMCSGVRDSTEFRYIPNLNDPKHVEIPNENRHVKCENRQKDLCIFREKNNILSISPGSAFHSVIIQNGGSSVIYS